MTFLDYLDNYKWRTNNAHEHAMIEMIMQNDRVKRAFDVFELFCVIDEEFSGYTELKQLVTRLWTQYAIETDMEKKSGLRFEATRELWSEVFDFCDCCHDDGRLREQFRQRPELFLLSAIASGLYEVADAIRERNS